MLMMEQGSWKGFKNRKSESLKEPVLWGREELPLVGHSTPGPSTIFCPSVCLKLAFRGTFSFSIRGQGACSTKARVLSGTGVGAMIIWKQRISSAGQRPQGTRSGTKLPSAGMLCPALQRPTPNTCPFGENGGILLTRTVFIWLSQAWARGKLFHLIFSLFFPDREPLSVPLAVMELGL